MLRACEEAIHVKFGDSHEAMRLTAHQWRSWSIWVLLVALVAGCGAGETKAVPPPGQPHDDGTTTQLPEEGGMQPAQELRHLPVELQDWPRIFTERINAGDLDGAAALYEPDARFVIPSGETLVGRDQMRRVLAGLIATQTRMQCQVIQAVAAGDIAILYTDFQYTTVEASGQTVEVKQKAIEVLRRQPDGTWRLIVGDPQGRMH